MKKHIILLFWTMGVLPLWAQTNSWIRINQVGYLNHDVKVAVLVLKDKNLTVAECEIVDALTQKSIYTSKKIQEFSEWGAFQKGFRLNFSDFHTEVTVDYDFPDELIEIGSNIFKSIALQILEE